MHNSSAFFPMGCPLIGAVVECGVLECFFCFVLFFKLLGSGEHMDNFHTYISCNTFFLSCSLP